MNAAERLPSAAELLDAWERGRGRSPVERAQALVGLACPGVDPGALDALSLGRRDARLLALRAQVFGSRCSGLVPCPDCGELLEFDLDLAGVGVGQAAVSSPLTEAPAPAAPHLPDASPPPAARSERAWAPGPSEPLDAVAPLTLSSAGFEVSFRLPTAADVASITADDIAGARLELLARCILSVREGSQECGVAALPPSVVGEVVERMAQEDPQADVRIELTCPSCHHGWEAPLDIATFLWREVEAWATRLLRDVHVLASVYGWREADVLAMSPWRREAYLELIGP